LALVTYCQCFPQCSGPGRWALVDEFTEVESGKGNDRPELIKALAACKKQKAKLVIAKLDRLSRNLAFIAMGYRYSRFCELYRSWEGKLLHSRRGYLRILTE
jgi:Resolvase, N terminal domain